MLEITFVSQLMGVHFNICFLNQYYSLLVTRLIWKKNGRFRRRKGKNMLSHLKHHLVKRQLLLTLVRGLISTHNMHTVVL